MSNFLNYENGDATVDNHRHVNAIPTTVEDIIESFHKEYTGALTADLGSWAEDHINNMWGTIPQSLNQEEVERFVFNEHDMIVILEEIGIDAGDLDYLWDLQHDFISDYLDS